MAPVWAKRRTQFQSGKRKSAAADIPPLNSSKVPKIDDAKLEYRVKPSLPKEVEINKPDAKESRSKINDSVQNIHSPAIASNIRQSVRIDLQPDICKQYYQTGRCKYGDSCKFLHERGDAKASASKDTQKWNEVRKAKVELKKQSKSSLSGCSICERDPPHTPVKPKCGHLCCESCFLTQFKNSASACNACGESLGASADLV